MAILKSDNIDAESRKILELIAKHPGSLIALDTEATGIRVAAGEDTCIGASIAAVIGNNAFSHYFPFRHEVGDNIGTETFNLFKQVMEEGEHTFIYVNAQFDILSLETVGIYLGPENFYDVPTMAHLIDENKPYAKSLDQLSQHYIDKKIGKVKDLNIEREKKSGWTNTDWRTIWNYAVTDAQLTWRLYEILRKRPEWLALPEDFWEHKQKLIRVLLAMKRQGVLINTGLAMEYVTRGEQEMARIVEELGINPASSKQMKTLLIDDLGLPVVKASQRTGAPSFDKQAMTKYDEMLEKMDSPVATLIKEYRGWQKAVTAAYRPYLSLRGPDDRLRCSYKTHGTATGRLSCSEPNLQQIPKSSDKPWNGKVKECFIAKPGFTLINADFSQLELRLATAYAGEEELKKVFEEGRDIFTEMSKQLGMSRHDTKTLVYSMQYGAGEQRIMDAFNVDRKQAKEIRANYFATYPNFRRFNERCTAKVEQTGTIKIWSGRERHFESTTEAYKAMNSVIQGGAADIVERIMVRCYDELQSEDCLMLLQVHDSITFEVRETKVHQYIEKIRTVMEDVNAVTGEVNFDVRFAVDVDKWVP